MSILIQNGLLADPANRIYEKKNILVVDGKINIDDNIMKWVDDSKGIVDAG